MCRGVRSQDSSQDATLGLCAFLWEIKRKRNLDGDDFNKIVRNFVQLFDELRQRQEGVLLSNFWSNKKLTFRSRFEQMQTFYTNCYSNGKGSFERHWKLAMKLVADGVVPKKGDKGFEAYALFAPFAKFYQSALAVCNLRNIWELPFPAIFFSATVEFAHAQNYGLGNSKKYPAHAPSSSPPLHYSKGGRLFLNDHAKDAAQVGGALIVFKDDAAKYTAVEDMPHIHCRIRSERERSSARGGLEVPYIVLRYRAISLDKYRPSAVAECGITRADFLQLQQKFLHQRAIDVAEVAKAVLLLQCKREVPAIADRALSMGVLERVLTAALEGRLRAGSIVLQRPCVDLTPPPPERPAPRQGMSVQWYKDHGLKAFIKEREVTVLHRTCKFYGKRCRILRLNGKNSLMQTLQGNEKMNVSSDFPVQWH